jgi:hypothetical protein
MWILVLTSEGGTIITNATFSINWYNRGDGWYFVYFSSYNQGFTCSAPGRNTVWGNNDYYSSITIWLTKYVAPPPPPPNCWS